MDNIVKDIVSSEDEPLILVDSEDRDIGSLSKSACHDGNGFLHRAFSIFLFDSDGCLLLQQRSDLKRLWPMYWSNSICSHPRFGETIQVATKRRLIEELGVETDLRYVYKFEYRASFGLKGSENELCYVFLGKLTEKPTVNVTEIAQIRYLSFEELNNELQERPKSFTPWFIQEWNHLREKYPLILTKYMS